MIVIGQWLSSLAVYSASASYTDDRPWRIPIITQLVPPAILLCGAFFLPESPSWLILRDTQTRHQEELRSPDLVE
jgi:MFS transporter, SP family, general alpha glucoside:H+ symporter